jgi:hypothetical protein
MSLSQSRCLQLIRHASWLEKAKTSQLPGSYLGSRLPLRRTFSSCQTRGTDGVYPALTEMRVRIPWIEALTKKKEDNGDKANKPSVAAEAIDRDLTPKRMSDSYHRVVCIP